MAHLDPYTQKLMHQVFGLGARLLQARDGMRCGHNELLENTTLYPIAFATRFY